MKKLTFLVAVIGIAILCAISCTSSPAGGNTATEQPEPPVEQPAEPVEQPEPPVEQPVELVEQPEPPIEPPAEPVEQPEPPVEQPVELVEQPEPPVEPPAKPVEQPEPPVELVKQPKPPVEQVVNNDLEQVYNKYKSGLLLDGATSYTVVSGDTLTRIATAYYGSGNGYYFPIIMMASIDTIQDPDFIEPGMNITIPDIEKNLSDSIARANVKAFLKEIAEAYVQSGKPYKGEMVSALTALSESL
ncbi:MAG: LysM peptidoglycan-binding domain-containing protein [Treponema sp.]|jgi:nucleoid-associated protein YgaU|nr:LysM peptidoglycan-binding domain-containing protein [Treponema sp.]